MKFIKNYLKDDFPLFYSNAYESTKKDIFFPSETNFGCIYAVFSEVTTPFKESVLREF